MKRYEVEAVAKNFTIFFLLQALLLWVIYIQNLNGEIKRVKESTLEKMKLCSFTLDCKEFTLDFEPKIKQEVSKLFIDKNEVYSLFHMPSSSKYLLKLSIPKEIFLKQKKIIKNNLQKEFLLYALFIATLSLLFSFYTLYPLKKALRLNEEFIKDILHDYNTPISSLLIDFKLFKKEIGDNKKIDRMQNSIDTMLMLQNNLKYFLQNSLQQKDIFLLKEILVQRVNHFKEEYSNLNFYINYEDIKIETNKDALIRVVDNLLSNACKYNIKDGFINIELIDNILYIKNSSKPIKNINKIFNRYYKEGQRGLGIGLDIVKKLCNLMNIKIDVKYNNSTVIFSLNLKEVILK